MGLEAPLSGAQNVALTRAVDATRGGARYRNYNRKASITLVGTAWSRPELQRPAADRFGELGEGASPSKGG
ncbi:hypothetical protein NKH80_14990 [Mesorhizobium sp. M0904]|uniref:hypothetical protein n=1 Tax=Mesorhizobium sp. M0904 TaxID=2957022 RepID=UPI003339118B